MYSTAWCGCGLDYFRDFSPRPAQRKAFERQLQIGVDTGKPLFLHQRDAHADFMAVMKDFEGRTGPAVVHCFTGTREEMFDCLDNGCISASPAGCATSAAAGTCANWCAASPRSG